MPKRTFKDSMTIGQGDERIELRYFGRAHTDGDVMVLFPAARVLHMADVFPTKGLPGMDANNGGTGVGFAETLSKVADFADRNNVEMIVNGHFEATTTRADLREYIQFVQEFVRTVQEGKKAGKSVDEVSKAWTTPARYAGYEPMPIAVRARANAELIFKETN
jgi:glyoxylase-like metal-dependent hydrolase (beta-lactamase superfamily II)